jgi:DNA topoisomerase-1
VLLDKKRFTPTDVGRVVNKFLTEHFTKYVDYDFTANLENALDSVAEGEREWVPLMDEFWRDFNHQIHIKADVERPGNELIDEACPKCGKPLQKQLSRYGSFIGCTGYNDTPKCDYKRSIDGAASAGTDPVTIGVEPESGKEIYMMNGPYGPYLQLGLPAEGDKKKPKRVSIPKEIPLSDVNLETANMLLSLPRDLGLHPETNKKIVANIGRFGPYINHDAKFKSIPKSMSVFSIDLNSAVDLLAQANTGPAPLCSLGSHPAEDGQIEVFAGRYGPYVQHGKIRATLPKSVEPESLTLEEALELLNAKAAKEAPAKKAVAKKTGVKKTATSKKTVEKPGAVKTAPKKSAPKKAPAKKAASKKTSSE